MSEISEGLASDLEQVGVRVRDVWDLVNSEARYPEAVPVLLAWLDRLPGLPADDARERLRVGILRALSVPYARGLAAPSIVRQFEEIADPNELGPRWVAGSALGVVADSGVADQVVGIILNRDLGRAREMVFEAIPRIAKQRPEIVQVVRSLLDDETVRPFVIAALGQVRDVQSRDQVAGYLSSEHPLTRRYAKTALRRLDAELARRGNPPAL